MGSLAWAWVSLERRSTIPFPAGVAAHTPAASTSTPLWNYGNIQVADCTASNFQVNQISADLADLACSVALHKCNHAARLRCSSPTRDRDRAQCRNNFLVGAVRSTSFEGVGSIAAALESNCGRIQWFMW